MKQVKLFNVDLNQRQEIERKINTWLAQNQGSEIYEIKFMSGLDTDGDMFYSAMIIYEDN